MEVVQTELKQEGIGRKKSSKKRKGRKESKDSAISDVSPKVTISRETSIDSGAGVNEDNNSSPLVKESGKEKNSPIEDKTQKKSTSKFRRHGSESVIVVKREIGDVDQAKQVSSLKKTIKIDSASSTPAPMLVLSPYAEFRHLSSPSASERSLNSPSTPRRSNSPELSKALRVKQERLHLEMAIAETRSKLKQHHIGEKPHAAEVDSKNARLSKKVLQRAKSLELSKLKYAEKTSLLNGKPGSHSLETIKALEENYSRQKHRSHSQKRYAVSLSNDNATLPKGNTHIIDATREGRDSVDSVSMETARTSAVVLNVYDSFHERNSVLPPLGESQESVSYRPPAVVSIGNRMSDPGGFHQDQDLTPGFLSQHSEEKNITKAGRIITLNSGIEKKTFTTLNSILNDALPPIPSTEDSQESAVLDWRPVFRAEMIRLRKEVNDFRQFCAKQVKENALLVQSSCNTQDEVSPSQPKNGLLLTTPPKVTDQLQDVDVNLHLLQRRQQLLDLEAELCSREKHLSEKQKYLDDYEKEIKEVESLLNQRQAICDRRQKALTSLDEELQQLRQEMEQARDQVHKDGTIPESNTDRARRNWDTVRRNLLDRQHLLETTVQKYRSELATASSNIAGKDILITRLQNTIVDYQEEMVNKDKRIKQLEAKLGLAISEARNLSEQLSSYTHRDVLGSSNYNRSDQFFPRRASQELTPDQSRSSFRGSMYRRPSTNAGSDHAEDHPKPVVTAALDHDSEQFRNNSRLLGKRSSISDNAITRLTLSTLKTDDKYGRGSSACVLQ